MDFKAIDAREFITGKTIDVRWLLSRSSTWHPETPFLTLFVSRIIRTNDTTELIVTDHAAPTGYGELERKKMASPAEHKARLANGAYRVTISRNQLLKGFSGK